MSTQAGDKAEPDVVELRPLPYDGVRSVAVGTVMWLIALLVMIPFADDLRADGRLWWIATAAVGFVLGLMGLWVVVRRRNRLRATAAEPD
ncbi:MULTISPECIES: DUF2530 domain-containing protein [Parafrankia]|uniref:DUF2530 domain-containing protein n=1 Tax=Parafrankia soli TaxID=2599596 RepID=A0A1S1Q0R3_9ACTN|nr:MULTISPECIES: DUF2530 domain-containing protein [Parafrankia]OHV27176.1 DUF2530 domain-containing protein [Parafrankia soli]TCJ35480.1 DUF2530 domain-containing protein [Parafrankia sp. BMG5.11]CAI7980177.1 DUF2530 domain-containing protein [Frankia sp. Hr75.2]SQD98298.1 conserved hypothetical protein [Parafrankia sp. Ea1.12]